MKVATKKTFRNGKYREVRAGKWSSGDDSQVIVAGAVTHCLNTVQQTLNGQVIDTFVWQGDLYYSNVSDRMLLVE